jgi:hypothetical protein
MKPIKEILQERGGTHGDFTYNSQAAQDLKDVMHSHQNWETLSSVQKEAIHMICHKLGRIAAGNPNFADHWLDLSGYAILVVERLEANEYDKTQNKKK